MKKRLVRIGILVALTSIVMLNLQILCDTSNSPFIQGATVKASDEFYGYYGDEGATGYNTDYLRFHYLKNVWCVVAYLDIDFDWRQLLTLSIPDLEIDCDIDFNGSKWACKEIAQDIYCSISKQTECKSNREDEGGDSPSDPF